MSFLRWLDDECITSAATVMMAVKRCGAECDVVHVSPETPGWLAGRFLFADDLTMILVGPESTQAFPAVQFSRRQIMLGPRFVGQNPASRQLHFSAPAAVAGIRSATLAVIAGVVSTSPGITTARTHTMGVTSSNTKVAAVFEGFGFSAGAAIKGIELYAQTTPRKSTMIL